MGGGKIRSRYQKGHISQFTVNKYFGKGIKNARLHKNFQALFVPYNLFQ